MKKNYPLYFVALISILLFSCESKSGKSISLFNLEDALMSANAGDTIYIKSGTYTDVSLLLSANGDSSQAIVIKAEKAGELIVTGDSYLKINGSHLVIDGFCFKDIVTTSKPIIVFKADGKVATHCRMTNCAIIDCNPSNRFLKSDWVNLYGRYNMIDHCTFEGKCNTGLLIAVKLSGPENLDNHHRIEHNLFRNRPRIGSNGGETLRVGTSTYSLKPSHTRVAYNYFERCCGEVEIVSIKSTENEIIGNVFYECEGVLALRHGNKNTVTDNIFIGNNVPNTGGIRVINAGHTITNNYFQELKGDRFWSALAIMNGVPNSAINRYHQVKDVTLSNNTFVNCDHIGFGVGSDEERTARPQNVSFDGNTIISDKAQTLHVLDDMSGISFTNNITSSTVTSMKNGFATKDLKHDKLSNGLYSIANYTSPELLDKTKCGATWVAANDNKVVAPRRVEIANARMLHDAFDNLQANDELVLTTADVFYITKPLLVNCKIKFTAAAGLENHPIIKYKSNTGDPIIILAEGTDLVLEHINIDGWTDDGIAPCAVSTQDQAFLKAYSFVANDCHFYNFNAGGRSVFKATSTSYANLLKFEDCVFSNVSGIAIHLKAEKEDVGRYNAENVILKNCLFYDVMGSAIDLYRGGNDESTSGPKLWIDHCTFNNVENRELGSVIKLTGVQEFSITNSLFSECGKSGRAIKMETPRWAKAQIDYCNFYHTGRLESFYTGIVKSHIWHEKPVFTSIEDNDYSLTDSKTFAHMTNDNSPLGYDK